MKFLSQTLMLLFALVFNMSLYAQEKELVAPIYLLVATGNGLGEQVGEITVERTKKGIEIYIEAEGLPAGSFGFHLHETNVTTPTGKGANLVIGGGMGAHWDPDKTNLHDGITFKGHRGDLPPVKVKKNGKVKQKIKSDRLTLDDMFGRGFVIHAHDDNLMNVPTNGGSGSRSYAAVFQNPRK